MLLPPVRDKDEYCALNPKIEGEPVCHVRKAVEMGDLGGRDRLREFNHHIVECYAVGGTNCYDLTFDKLLYPLE